MILQIKVYFDYVCLFCFVGKVVFEEVIKDKDVQVEWMLFELCLSFLLKFDLVNDFVKWQMWENLIELMVWFLGVDIMFFCVLLYFYMDLVFEGFYFVKEYGKESEYYICVFWVFFQEE